jgi:predicted nucleic acid-binding protein
LIRQKVELNVSALVFDELWWLLFRKCHEQAVGQSLTNEAYKQNPNVWRNCWPRIRQITHDIRGWGRINELPYMSPGDLVTGAVGLMDNNHLSPRDAFHLAVTLHHGIPSFVTNDRDFDNVQLPAGVNLTIIKF